MRLANERYSSRTIEAVEGIRGHQVREVSIRPDCLRIRLTLEDGSVLVVSVQLDRSGAPHLDADLLHLLQPAPEVPDPAPDRREGKR
jgi:hypothetical protein